MSEPGTVAWERARAERAEAEVDRLRHALRFYANVTRYQGPNQRNGGEDPFTPKDQPYIQDVTRDYGEIARRTLTWEEPHDPQVRHQGR